jgi:hypothetical protein
VIVGPGLQFTMSAEYARSSSRPYTDPAMF